MADRSTCISCSYHAGSWSCTNGSCPNYVEVAYCEYCDEPYAADHGEPHPVREVVFCSKSCVGKYDDTRDQEEEVCPDSDTASS